MRWTGRETSRMPVFREHDDRGAARLRRTRSVRADVVDLADVVERRADRRDRRAAGCSRDAAGRRASASAGTSASTSFAASAIHRVDAIDARGPQKSNSGNVPSVACSSSRRPAGARVDVGQLAPVGRIHRPRRDAVVRRRIHVEPPEQVRAGERRILGARGLPDLRRLHQPVRLAPEPHLAVVAHVPAVADDAVLVGIAAGEVVGLRRAGDGGKRRLRSGRSPLACPAATRARRARSVGGQPDDVEDDGLLHGLTRRAAIRDRVRVNSSEPRGGVPAIPMQLIRSTSRSTHSYSRAIDSSRSIFSAAGSTSQV